MLTPIVQFIRNLLCVCRNFIPADHFVMQPYPALSFGIFSSEISLMEYVVAITQIYPVIQLSYSGVNGALKAYADYHKFSSGLSIIDGESFSVGGGESCIVRHGLTKARAASLNKLIGSILEIILGFTFIYLAATNLHIYLPDHPKAVIDAIIVAELVLLYFLVVMWQTFTSHFMDSIKLRKLSALLRARSKCQTMDEFTMAIGDAGYLRASGMHDALMALKPDHSPAWSTKYPIRIDQAVKSELLSVTMALKAFLGDSASAESLRATTADALITAAEGRIRRAPLDFLYFVLNVAAGYGYMLGCAVYYFPSSTGGSVLETLKFNLTHSDADWWGNFTGDAAWTIEPIVIITESLSPSQPPVTASSPIASAPVMDPSPTQESTSARNGRKSVAASADDGAKDSSTSKIRRRKSTK